MSKPETGIEEEQINQRAEEQEEEEEPFSESELFGEHNAEAEKLDIVNKKIAQILRRLVSHHEAIHQETIEIECSKQNVLITGSIVDSLETAPPLLDPSSSSKSEEEEKGGKSQDQILAKHKLLLKGKEKSIHKIESEIEQHAKTLDSLEEQLQSALYEKTSLMMQIYYAQDEIRNAETNQEQINAESKFIDIQLQELEKETQYFAKLKVSAETAFQKLKDHERNLQSNDGESVKLAKTVKSLDNELLLLEKQIGSIKKGIDTTDTYSEAQSISQNSERAIIEKSTNWNEEKIQLQNQILSLKTEIKQTKRQEKLNWDAVSSAERISSLNEDQIARFGPFIKKWNNLITNTNLDETSENKFKGGIEKLWEKIIEPRNRITVLLEDNSKLEEQLKTKKEGLNRSVQRFHNHEEKSLKEKRASLMDLKKEEEDLLKRIKRLKLKIEEKRLRSADIF